MNLDSRRFSNFYQRRLSGFRLSAAAILSAFSFAARRMEMLEQAQQYDVM